MTGRSCRVPRCRALAVLLSMAVLLFAPAPAGPAGPSQAPSRPPRLVVLAFSVSSGKGVPNSPLFQGVLSREVAREIGRRIDSLSKLEIRFYTVRTTAAGRPQFVITQEMLSPQEARLLGARMQAVYTLDGLITATDHLALRVRLQETKTGKLLLLKDDSAPMDEAGPLMERAARQVLLALPGDLGAKARTAPPPAHEPKWAPLLAYLQAEDLRLSRQSGVGEGELGPIFDRYLTAVQLDPAYSAPADGLIELALPALRQGVGTADVPISALKRLAVLRPGAQAQAALAHGLESAGRPIDAEEAWRKSIEVDPTFILGWVHVAEGRRRRGDYRGAASALEKALAIGFSTPRLKARAQSDLGALYTEIGEVDKAISLLEASVKANPKDPDAYFRLGSAYNKKGEETPKENKRWIDLAAKAFETADRLRGSEEPLEPSARGPK